MGPETTISATAPLTDDELALIDRYNPLLTEPLSAQHVKPRLLGHRLAARSYTRENGEGDPQIAGWTWQSSAQ
jgi:xylulose-5-phosphate/fructose-6-phosphate phosphoketolase